MKMKISFVIVAAFIAVAILLTKTQKTQICDSMLLQNIEAIASSESGFQYCVGDGDVDCPIADVKVDYYVSYSLPLEKY